MKKFDDDDLLWIAESEECCDLIVNLLDYNVTIGEWKENLEYAKIQAIGLVNLCEFILYKLTDDWMEVGKYTTGIGGFKMKSRVFKGLDRDDFEDYCGMIKNVLTRFECRYDMCCNWEELIRKIQQLAIDLVYNLDYMIHEAETRDAED